MKTIYEYDEGLHRDIRYDDDNNKTTYLSVFQALSFDSGEYLVAEPEIIISTQELHSIGLVAAFDLAFTEAKKVYAEWVKDIGKHPNKVKWEIE